MMCPATLARWLSQAVFILPILTSTGEANQPPRPDTNVSVNKLLFAVVVPNDGNLDTIIPIPNLTNALKVIKMKALRLVEQMRRLVEQMRW